MPDTTTIRRFRWRDLARWTGIFNDICGLADTERAFDDELMLQFLSQPACKPEENCFLAESGELPVGFVLIAPELPIGRTVCSGGVVETHWNGGIGHALLQKAVQHSEALGASVLHIQVPPDSLAGRHMLESNGFRHVRTYALMRWEGSEVPHPELPAGFGLRSLKVGQDEQTLTELQNTAFGGSWGFCPNTVEEIEARLKFKTCDPDGVIFVTKGESLAGYNWTFRATGPTASTGWIGMTGIHPFHRRHGLGRAVVLAGMNYLTAKGVRAIELEVDEENAAAKEMYLSIGFRKAMQMLWYERALTDARHGTKG